MTAITWLHQSTPGRILKDYNAIGKTALVEQLQVEEDTVREEPLSATKDHWIDNQLEVSDKTSHH